MEFLIRKIRRHFMSFSGIGTSVRFVADMIVTKVIALLLGTEGIALLGNLKNAVTSMKTIATLGLFDGVVQKVLVVKDDKEEMKALLSSAYFICFVVTMVLSAWLYFDPIFWNDVIFGKPYDFSYIFKQLGIALSFYGVNVLCTSIVKGFSKYKVYILLNMVGSLLGLFITLILVWEFRLEGAFIAIVLNPAISLFVTIVIISNQKNFAKLLWANRISKKYIKQLAPYAIIGILSGAIFPFVKINIRNQIASLYGMKTAGYWEAMQQISDHYWLFFIGSLTVYISTKLRVRYAKDTFRDVVEAYLKEIMPFVAGCFLIIFVFKKEIISFVLSVDFMPMEAVFKWQLIGDFLKMITLVFSYQLVARGWFVQYVVIELISVAIFYGSSVFLINEYSFVGGAMAYTLYAACTFLFTVLLFKDVFIIRKN
ncbi:O-antigen translocase [Aquimarina hainanensis]